MRLLARRFRTQARWSMGMAAIASAGLHAVLLIALALWVLRGQHRQPLLQLTSVSDVVEKELETLVVPEPSAAIAGSSPSASDVSTAAASAIHGGGPALHAPMITAPWASTEAEGPRATMLSDVAPLNLLRKTNSFVAGGGFRGRASRAGLLAAYGGTAESEDAVGLGLRWLAAHQRDSGGWSLDHQKAPCNGQCRHPGTFGSATGATGLALLPFLGANHCSTNGEYRDVVRRGIYFLESRLRETRHGGDIQDGSMYSQGVATIALCENYALSKDESHRRAAQLAVDFICSAQHSKGGWRYVPGQPGDTTVTGWQLMALKSAKLAGLRAPSPVVELAKQYLDSVQTNDGANYGYLLRGADPSPTAVGLLMRMYTGWPREDERLQAGIDYLIQRGPSRTDAYFNYYATQVLHHHRGPAWKAWNTQLRDQLIASQATEGHERGSWHFDDKHNKAGGRLYSTSLCVMILEVYYRHMPLYDDKAVGEAW